MNECTHPLQTAYGNAAKMQRMLFTKQGPINTTVYPTWIGDSDCFWYLRDLKGEPVGKEFRLVDARTQSNELAFDHEQLASALADAAKQSVDARELPFYVIDINLTKGLVSFDAFDQRWCFDQKNGSCVTIETLASEGEIVSPDGHSLVFQRDHNLWLRDIKSGEERALTTDGEADHAYGEGTFAWGMVNEPGILEVRWSADSRRIFATQNDLRQVKSLPVVHHVPSDGSMRPQVEFIKLAYPGDEHIETVRMLSIDVVTGEQQAADYAAIPATRNSFGVFTANLAWWNKDSRRAYFVHVDRYYKFARLIEFDTHTGNTRMLFEETSDTQINLMNNGDMHPSFVPLADTDELLWYSERSGWAHLYLYDLNTGQLKNAVTQGGWLVRDVITVDLERREVFLQTGCRTPDRHAYYRDLVRVNMDTGELLELASSDHDYYAGAFTDIQGISIIGRRRDPQKRGISPTGNYGVVTRSRVDTLPESILLDREGQELMMLDKADISALPTNWSWPEPVSMVATDGKTDIYGVIYRPADFAPDKSYPVILDMFNNPDFPWSPIGGFDNNLFEGMTFYNAAALAELGFIVVQIDGRGCSYRDQAFKDAGYGNLQLPGFLEDQVAGLKQLAERYPPMDLNRVGCLECMGGQGVMKALLDYPDFFKVGVTHILHDTRLMSAPMWGEMFEGKAGSNSPFPEEKVEHLKGKLLMMCGMVDAIGPPASVFRIVESLQKANKDFDMLLLPKLEHAQSNYLIRRSWDYMVQHLMGEEPPKEARVDWVFGDTIDIGVTAS